MVTALSRAYYRLLAHTSESNRHHFVLPSSLLDQPLPNPGQFRQRYLTLSTHERYSLSGVTRELAGRGYRRHRHTTEPGAFVIQGERITVSHPYRQVHYTITFYHHYVEQIVACAARPHDNSPKPYQTVQQLSLPPLGFPRPSKRWKSILAPSVVFRPSYLQRLPARQTVVGDALHPAVRFPVSDTEAGLSLSREKRRPASPITYERGLELARELRTGRPAVHSDHGIGIFEGLNSREINGQENEYIILRYADGGTLSVPVTYAHKVSAYIGEGNPPLNRLGDATWTKIKRKARANAAHLARELLEVAGQRANLRRTGCTIDNISTIDKHTPYKLTSGQRQAWREVADDMRGSRPMDRLIVGDVGFGKTEIALRAAWSAVKNGRQVAVLAPTTLLVQQHYDLLRSRLPGMTDNIALLSRLSSPAQQRKIRRQIASGAVKIAVGTHGLLSPTLNWHNLGLAVIDEEHRFGVKQKEHFKKIRARTDILSLSATPIPRTLSLALSNLKALSVITTPPAGRQDTDITVSRENDSILKQAIQKEMAREGQTYIVAPRIRNLAALRERVKSLVPSARTALVHGQVPSRKLAATIRAFDRGEVDVLISSSIVASGLDFPGANCMIVTSATHFGLADLYQLRGRIGRRNRQGCVYYLYNSQKLNGRQRRRLAALTEAARLGSGWQLARRDLELRGAGNLLGAEQSGAVQSVGLSLYLDMVQEAAHKEKGRPSGLSRQVAIHLPVTGRIPIHYLPSLKERTRWYGRLTRAATEQQLEDCLKEVEQNYGPIPPSLNNFISLLKLKLAASQAGITSITSTAVKPPGKKPFDRLMLSGNNLPSVLSSLLRKGHWRIKGNSLTLDTKGITLRLINQLLLQLRDVPTCACDQNKQLSLPLSSARNI